MLDKKWRKGFRGVLIVVARVAMHQVIVGERGRHTKIRKKERETEILNLNNIPPCIGELGDNFLVKQDKHVQEISSSIDIMGASMIEKQMKLGG